TVRSTLPRITGSIAVEAPTSRENAEPGAQTVTCAPFSSYSFQRGFRNRTRFLARTMRQSNWRDFLRPMLAIRDNLAQCFSALRSHKLRASLTMLGLTIGVATLITVMTIVQGANRYVEQKIANLGTNVFQIARTPFAVTDFNIIIKAL